jgi:hypothetical protein
MLTLIALLRFAIGAGTAKRSIFINKGLMYNPSFAGSKVGMLVK